MSSPVESTSSSSSSVALLYSDIWKVKFRKDSLSASMFPLAHPLVCLCATSGQSAKLQGRVSGHIWFCLVWRSSNSNTRVDFERVCVSALLSEALSCSLQPRENLSQPPWCVADTPLEANVTTAEKALYSPRAKFSSRNSYFSPAGANMARESEQVKNRKDCWLERLTWLRLSVWKWLCECIPECGFT